MVTITVEYVSISVASPAIEAIMEAAITARIAAGASWLPETVPGIEVFNATTPPVKMAPMRANPIPFAKKP